MGTEKENAISKQRGTSAMEDEPADHASLSQDKQDLKLSKYDLQTA